MKTIFAELILEDQDCFASDEGYETLLKLIPDGSIVATLAERWQDDPQRSSVDKWEDIRKEMKKYERNSRERVRIVSPPLFNDARIFAYPLRSRRTQHPSTPHHDTHTLSGSS